METNDLLGALSGPLPPVTQTLIENAVAIARSVQIDLDAGVSKIGSVVRSDQVDHAIIAAARALTGVEEFVLTDSYNEAGMDWFVTIAHVASIVSGNCFDPMVYTTKIATYFADELEAIAKADKKAAADAKAEKAQVAWHVTGSISPCCKASTTPCCESDVTCNTCLGFISYAQLLPADSSPAGAGDKCGYCGGLLSSCKHDEQYPIGKDGACNNISGECNSTSFKPTELGWVECKQCFWNSYDPNGLSLKPVKPAKAKSSFEPPWLIHYHALKSKGEATAP